MKKTRVLATVLSLMMLVCALPVVQVSAAEVPADLGKAIAAVMNENDGTAYLSAEPAQANANWYAMNEDFTQYSVDSYEELQALLEQKKFTYFKASQTEGPAITFDSTNGLVFPDDHESEFVLCPWALNPGKGSDGNPYGTWGSWAVSNYFGFTFELEEDGHIDWRAGIEWTGNQARVIIRTTGVTVYGGNAAAGDTEAEKEKLVDYQPGTGLSDALLHKNDTGYDLYLKKHTDSAFTKVASVPYFASRGNIKRGNNVYGKKASIRNAIAYAGSLLDPKDSIEEILGKTTGSTYALDFNADSSFANTPGTSGVRDGFCNGAVWNSGINSDLSKYEFDADGLTLKDEYKEVAGDKFIAWGAHAFWSPLNALNPNADGNPYSRQALYVKAKGNFNLRLKGPANGTRMEFQVAVGSDIGRDCCAMENIASVTIQDELTEYLIVPDEIISGAPDTAVLYVKGENATGGKWWNSKKITFGTTSSSWANVGLLFNKVTGHVKSVRTLAVADSISDAEATPEGAECLYFDEEFKAEPVYTNGDHTRVTYVDDNAVLGASEEGNAKVAVYDLAIPTGGYAEFKVQYDGVAYYRISDGVNCFNITQQSDYGSITAGNAFSGTNNTAWRTWRIVKNLDGTYNVYSKTEGDTGWFVHATSGADIIGNGIALMEFEFTKANDGGNGNSKLAYLKVYGAAPADELAFIDGYTATTVAEGVELAYPKALRVIASQNAGKLLVVSYKSNGSIAKMNIFDVERDLVGGKYLDLDAYSDGSKVRFFLWEDFGNIENLTDVVPTYSVIDNIFEF